MSHRSKCKMMKPLEENMWENLYNLELVDSLE